MGFMNIPISKSGLNIAKIPNVRLPAHCESIIVIVESNKQKDYNTDTDWYNQPVQESLLSLT